MQPTGYRRKIALAEIFVSTLLFVSCDPNFEQDVFTGTIMPLKIGNQWAYKIRIFNELGAVTDSSYDTVKIASQAIIGKETWYIDNEGNVQTNRPDGRWIRSDYPYLVEKFPARLNEFYRLIDTATIVRVRGVDETIIVPAGRYFSYVYQWRRNNFLVADFYFAPNVGMIKSEKYMQSGPGVFMVERKELLWVLLKQ